MTVPAPAHVRMRVALADALARHGVNPTIAEAVVLDLMGGNDPRPEHLPASFTIDGVTLAWPEGREARYTQDNERRPFNRVLKNRSKDTLPTECQARLLREVYETLHNLTKQPDYVSRPIVALPIPPAPSFSPLRVKGRVLGSEKPKPLPKPVVEHTVPKDESMVVLENALANLRAVLGPLQEAK